MTVKRRSAGILLHPTSLPGRYGIRSEIDVCLVAGKAENRGGEPQREIPALLQ